MIGAIALGYFGDYLSFTLYCGWIWRMFAQAVVRRQSCICAIFPAGSGNRAPQRGWAGFSTASTCIYTRSWPRRSWHSSWCWTFGTMRFEKRARGFRRPFSSVGHWAADSLGGLAIVWDVAGP